MENEERGRAEEGLKGFSNQLIGYRKQEVLGPFPESVTEVFRYRARINKRGFRRAR